MWPLGTEWSDLADGLTEVQLLQLDLRRRYDNDIAVAREHAFATAQAGRGWLQRLLRLQQRLEPSMVPPSIDIEAEWWHRVHARPHRPVAPAHGDAGVDLFLKKLNARLDSRYLVLRDVLVARGLDVDTLIVGPTGIWVFEVKYWNADIFCVNGQWWKDQSHYGPGGVRRTEQHIISEHAAPDRQWLREREAVQETLRRRLTHPVLEPQHLQGGLVFTHPNGSWHCDSSIRSGYGSPGFWVDQVMSAPCDKRFEIDERLRVVDVLCARRRQIESEQEAQSAAELARGLHQAAAEHAARFVRQWKPQATEGAA